MKLRIDLVVTGMLILLSARPMPAAEGPGEMVLNHRTLNFQTDKLQRVEISGSLAAEGGKAKVTYTVYESYVARNVFGDRIGHPLDGSKSTEHHVTLEPLSAHEQAQERWKDPSPAQDRVLYRFKGIDLGTNRQFLLMVSPKGPQRLIFVNRCGSVWAAALEPRNSFEGPVAKTD